jgi:hypothetical protein
MMRVPWVTGAPNVKSAGSCEMASKLVFMIFGNGLNALISLCLIPYRGGIAQVRRKAPIYRNAQNDKVDQLLKIDPR